MNRVIQERRVPLIQFEDCFNKCYASMSLLSRNGNVTFSSCGFFLSFLYCRCSIYVEERPVQDVGMSIPPF